MTYAPPRGPRPLAWASLNRTFGAHVPTPEDSALPAFGVWPPRRCLTCKEQLLANGAENAMVRVQDDAVRSKRQRELAALHARALHPDQTELKQLLV